MQASSHHSKTKDTSQRDSACYPGLSRVDTDGVPAPIERIRVIDTQYPRGAERDPVRVDEIEKGDTVAIDFENGLVTHEGNTYHFPALPVEVLAILEDGGLIPHVRKELGKG
ncbi:hypothetical protein KAT59_08010 [Candidatus Bipolaricaulota bacterium]|nr:hypothetical protein [Candidatus Bipolaricaulota bacterium]